MTRVILLILCLVPAAAVADCIELIEFEIEDELVVAELHDGVGGQLVAMLIPVQKAYCSDRGFEACVLGQQLQFGFSDDPQEWALMDWDGRFNEAYDLTEDTVNVMIFDAGGCMLGRVSGDSPDPILIDALLEHFP